MAPIDTETEALIIIIWSLGVLVTLGAPALVFALWRLGWKRLPDSRALTKGPGPNPVEVDDAFVAFKEAWWLLFREHVDVDRYLVVWLPGAFFTDENVRDKKTGEMLPLAGIADGPKKARVACPKGASVGETEFFHELAHSALMQHGKGSRDKDHESWTAAHWQLVKQLEEHFS